MTRYLKTLGLALCAMLAIGALSAASASAQSVLTSDGPVTLTGNSNDQEENTWHMFGAAITCTGPYTGHKYTTQEETTHEETTNDEHNTLIPNEANTITITPHYAECEGEKAVDMNGCDFVFHIGETIGEDEGTYELTTDIVCPENSTIAMTGGACTTTIGPQTGLTGAHLTNKAAEEPSAPTDYLRFTGTIGGIHATACHFLTTTEATLVIDQTIKADDEGGNPAGITISHE